MTLKWFYYGLSYIAPLYYGLLSLHHVLSRNDIIQDDMRQHVVWFQRLVDPALFPHDPIADYYQSVSPLGYRWVYETAHSLGMEPLLFAKCLPLGLALITTGYVFNLTLAIAPVPFAAFLSSLILNQHLWLNDDLVSATPRAFVYPLFAAFLYYLVQRSLLPILLTIALLGLFFPPMMLVAVALLWIRLLVRQGTRVSLTSNWETWRLALTGLIVAIAAILPFALNLSQFGASITADQMRSLPEYGLGGRSEYFGVHSWDFFLNGSSGLRLPVFPSVIWAGFALPWICRWRSPVLSTITPNLRVLSDLTLAALGMFGLAHLLLLRLHYPSRYTYHSLRFVLAIAAGIVLAAVIQSVWQRGQFQFPSPTARINYRRVTLAWISLAAVILIGVPAFPHLIFAFQGWVVGDAPQIYTYLRQQPKDAIVASLVTEADNVPAFALRSTWVGREFAISHHPLYYEILRTRASDLLRALYSPHGSNLQTLFREHNITFIWIESSFPDPVILQQDWLLHSSLQRQVHETIAALNQGTIPAILPYISRCTLVSSDRHQLLSVSCLQSVLESPERG